MNNKTNPWVLVAKAFQVGWDIAGGLLCGVILGLWLDHILHTKALFLLAFSLWGIIHGFKAMIQMGEHHD